MDTQPNPSNLNQEKDPYKDFGVIENVDKETRIQLFKKHSKAQFYWFSAVSLIWILFWSWQLLKQLQSNYVSDIRGYFIAIALPFIIFAFMYATFRNKILELFMRQFAKENSLNYLASRQKFSDELGSLFHLGRDKYLSHIIGGKLSNHDIKIFYYQYTIGSGKNSQTFHSTVLRITNDHIVPPILLVVDKQYFGGIKPNFENSVKIKPESNFDAGFDLFTKQKYEIEALQVFDPEFINLMQKRWKIFNIDFSGNEVYIFTNKQVTDKLAIQNMLALGKYILENIDPKLQKMQNSIMNLHELNPNNK